ncbi:MAG: low specificity L-threonine aldolase [Limnochordales bacterium]|nr:low specificity L-threonine aldolase [Limnochordales bacterium]
MNAIPATMNFASDNNAPVHPKIIEAIVRANRGHVLAYGEDVYTRRAVAKFREVFGPDVEVFFVFNGTGANVLGLASLVRPYNAIICAETAHIYTDECGAPERFTGCKLLPLPTSDGKIRVDQVRSHLHVSGVEHHAQPKVVSITQATEYGTVYTPDEIRELADFVHNRGMFLHMDGARLANAAASLGVSLRALTTDAGVDVLSFGGTKNGLMFGEAVVFFNPTLSREFRFLRKQGLQLAAKMRYVAVQFEALLTDDLWLENARHANRMARLLADRLQGVPGVTITQKVEANAVFARIPRRAVAGLQAKYFFYVWDENASADEVEVRWMTSFDTEEAHVLDFVEAIKREVDFPGR